MNESYELFFEKLNEAVSSIEPRYFLTKVAFHDESIYRERVYCYELYHQLRKKLPNTFPYQLCGELDKKGHPLFSRGIIPDFVLHKPGEMGETSNLCVVEVKPISSSYDQFEEDFGKLSDMVRMVNGYYRGISLVYGYASTERKAKLNELMNHFSTGVEDKLSIWYHNDTGQTLAN